jgi:hypothetical protein
VVVVSLTGESLSIHNGKPDQIAVQITQNPDSTLPALAVGGDVAVRGNHTVSGSQTVNGVTASGAPAIGQVQVATSSTAIGWASPVNAGPWVFDARVNGAVGDGQAATDGAITSSQNILTCATSRPFRASDVGKAIQVKGALTSGATSLVTTITGYTSASTVTLGASATNTMSGNALVLWATDDTAAIQATINAAFAYGQTKGIGVVSLPPAAGLFYGVAGALVAGGATKANGQLTIPIQADTANKVELVFLGVTDGGTTRHWHQKTPQLSGSTIVSFGVFANATAQTNSLTANGNPAVISGQTGANGYGGDTLVYSNVLVRMQNMQVYTTHSESGWTYSALNFHGVAAAALENFGYGTTGTYANADFNNPNGFSAGLSVGVLLPSAGNNDNNQLRNVICHGGYTRGIYLTEHTDWIGGTMLYCWSGICPVGNYGDGGNGVGASHGVNRSHISIEGCNLILEIIGPGQAGIGPMITGSVDTEGASEIRDNSSGLVAACGELHLKGNGGTSPQIDSGTPLAVICDFQFPGLVASPPALTIDTAIKNPYGRYANVTLAGGTVTSVQLSALLGGTASPAMSTVYSQSSGAMPLHTVRVGPQGWIQVNGTVTPTTNTWWLE